MLGFGGRVSHPNQVAMSGPGESVSRSIEGVIQEGIDIYQGQKEEFAASERFSDRE